MLSHEIYRSFLNTVVKNGVFSEDELARDSHPLRDDIMKAIRSKKRVDHRLPYLARVSGKGGTDSRGKRHASIRNVSLVEHVTSVARGALVFAEGDLREAGGWPDETALKIRLARVVAVGFLHDADKMIGKGRELLNVNTIERLIRLYRVDEFLGVWNASVSPEWMLAMIDQAEVSRAGRMVPGGVALSVTDRGDAAYVRCADRLEGKFLANGPHVALDELDAFEGFRAPMAIKAGWQILDIYQPHIPFVLDALQIGFANGCRLETGVPPLLETNQDGRLIVAVPADRFEKIREQALSEVARRFGKFPRISVNTRWAIDLHDARATVEDLRKAVSEERTGSRILALRRDLVTAGTELRLAVDEAFEDLGLSIDWPSVDRISGAMVRLLPGRNDDHHTTAFENGRMIGVGLRCKEPLDRKLASVTADSGTREAELLAIFQENECSVPDAILSLDHGITRQSVLALLAGGVCSPQQDRDFYDAVFGEAGLLERWLNGDSRSAGLNARIPESASSQFVEPVRDMLEQAINGRFVTGVEGASRRCHFTNTPVEESSLYKSKSEGIYALKVSAFSGREGRPESHRSTRSGTYLSPLARTEHALRFRDNHRRDAKNISFLLSSPSVSGLFASLTLGPDTEITEISTYELCTLDVKKVNKTFSAFDSYERRILIGRYESQEAGLSEAIDMVLRIVEASLRAGRAIHVFQGLPHEVNDRVYFDSLPHEIVRGLGRKGFRIEDLTEARNQLRIWNNVCRAKRLGVSLATAIMNPDTRLTALCEAITQIERSEDNELASLRFELLQQAQGLIMTDTDASPIVRFARAMTGFQSAPHRDSSQNDRTRGMRLAIEALDELGRTGTTDRETVICAVVAEIENAAERETAKQFTARREGDPTHREALTRAAEIFADEVWLKVFKGRSPDSRSRRSAVGIYRVAFERAHQQRKGGEAVFPT